MMIAQLDIAPRISDILWPDKERASDDSKAGMIRLALMTAMLSVFFEKSGKLFRYNFDSNFELTFMLAGMVLVLPFVLVKKYSRMAILAFILLLLPSVYSNWATYANHSWLSLWTIPAALLFTKYWDDALYAHYIRITLGIVMIAAFSQKILAGTYVDGTYIAYLSHFGSTTENMFKFLCNDATLLTPCGWHRFIGVFIVAWQLAVGVLLLVGVRSTWLLLIEITFLLGAGLFADEMNFQVLNIALLCIAFRVGVSWRLFAICFSLLIIDMHGIGKFIDYVV